MSGERLTHHRILQIGSSELYQLKELLTLPQTKLYIGGHGVPSQCFVSTPQSFAAYLNDALLSCNHTQEMKTSAAAKSAVAAKRKSDANAITKSSYKFKLMISVFVILGQKLKMK